MPSGGGIHVLFFFRFLLYSLAFFDISNIDLLVFLFLLWSDNNNNSNHVRVDGCIMLQPRISIMPARRRLAGQNQTWPLQTYRSRCVSCPRFSARAGGGVVLLCTGTCRDGAWRSPAPRQGRARPCLRRCRSTRGRASARRRLPLLLPAVGSEPRRTGRCGGCHG